MAEWKQALLNVLRLVSFLGLVWGLNDLFVAFVFGHQYKPRQPVWVTVLCAFAYGSIRYARKAMIRRA
jgi:hypothetical protein